MTFSQSYFLKFTEKKARYLKLLRLETEMYGPVLCCPLLEDGYTYCHKCAIRHVVAVQWTLTLAESPVLVCQWETSTHCS